MPGFEWMKAVRPYYHCCELCILTLHREKWYKVSSAEHRQNG